MKIVSLRKDEKEGDRKKITTFVIQSGLYRTQKILHNLKYH